MKNLKLFFLAALIAFPAHAQLKAVAKQTNITGNAGTATIADAASDTTTWCLLGTSATGSLAPASDGGCTYNASTNTLTLTGGMVSVGLTSTAIADVTVTNTATATSGTFALHTFPPAAGWFQMNSNPSGASGAITFALVGYNTYTSTSDTTGNGHRGGVLGVVDFTNTGDPLWGVPVEGRCNATGTGSEDSESMTTCSDFVATSDNDADGAGDVGIYIQFYGVANSDLGHFGTKLGLFLDDANLTNRLDGPLTLNNTVANASTQEIHSTALVDPARYYGPQGGNDTAGFGAGGVAQSAGDLWCSKVILAKRGAIDSVATKVTVNGGGATLRYCVYQMASTGLPGTLIADSGSVTATGTGVKTTAAITTSTEAQEVWACEVAQGAGLTMLFDFISAPHEYYGLDASMTASQSAAKQTSVTSTCPDPFAGTWAAASNLGPVVMISK